MKRAAKRAAGAPAVERPRQAAKKRAASLAPAPAPELSQVLSMAGIPGDKSAAGAGDAPGEQPRPQPSYSPFGVIVDDHALAAPGQIARSAFLARAVDAVERAADEELTAIGRTAQNCPYIVHWVRFYRGQSAAHIERMIQRYAGMPEGRDAEALVAAIVRRVRIATRTWIESSGAVVEAPREVSWLGSTDGIMPLPPGERLDAPLRTRLERTFGRSFDDVRVHDDAHSAAMADHYQARAFTVGRDVAFARGEYRPGALHSDLLVAHELAHVVQQSGGSGPINMAPAPGLEREANRAAAFSGRLGPPAGLSTGQGLRLQRCKSGGEEAEETVAAAPTEFVLPEDAATPDTGPQGQPGQPGAPGQPAQPPADVSLPTIAADEWEPVTSADAAIILLGRLEGSTENRIFVIPARGLVFQPAQPVPTAVMALPAAGHAGVGIVHTGVGSGILLDAGTSRSGPPNVLVSTSLTWLRTRLNISRIQGAMITHTHQDHVNGLNLFQQQGNITAKNVWVYPGWGAATAGPLATQLQQGGWTINNLQTHNITGPTGKQYTTARLTVGEATFEVVTDTAKLQEYNRRLRAGRWSGSRGATQVADPASMLTRISFGQGRPEALWLGDLRGRDIERLHGDMGDANFRQFIGNASVISGFHHLGAVREASDVRGLQHLLRAMGGRPFTVIAQTGGRSEVNMSLVRALQASGGRVLFLERPDASRATDITVKPSGAVTGQGAREFAVEAAVAGAQKRIAQLEAAAKVMERLPEYRERLDLKRPDIVQGLRSEAARLQRELTARMEISTNQLSPALRSANATQLLETNRQNLEATQGMEQTLGQQQVQRLSRLRPRLTELEKEIAATRSRAEASSRMRQLIAEADPSMMRDLKLMVGQMKGRSRSEQRAAWRGIRARLEAQRNIQQAITMRSGAPSARSRGFAWFGLAMEAWNLASPFISAALQESDNQDREDFYRFFRDLYWWQEKGLNPLARGVQGAVELTNADLTDARTMNALFGGIERRLHADLPQDAQKKATLSPAAAGAAAVEKLYIPELNQWPAERRSQFWTTLALWTSEHVNNSDDYNSEFEESLPSVPVRQVMEKDKGFGDRRWQIRVGRLGTDGHVHVLWQDSEDLTRIMNVMAERVIENTKKEIEQRWAERNPPPTAPSQTPSVGAPHSTRPTRRVKLTSSNRKVYSVWGLTENEVYSIGATSEDRRFFELGRKSAPDGYAWVIAGDYNTYTRIRGMPIWTLTNRVKIPRQPPDLDVNDPNFMKTRKPEEYMNAEELEAHRLSTMDPRPAGVFRENFSKSESSVYQAEVVIYHKGPNLAGELLVKKDDIVEVTE
jgi:hypothetical protein